MRRAVLAAALLLAGCGEQILQVGDDPARDDCRWVVTRTKPAVIHLEDIERCVGNIEFLVWLGDEG